MKKRLRERKLILNTRKNTSIQETRVFIRFRTLPLSFASCLKFYFFFSVIETSKPVKLKDFSEHYRIMSADSDFRFSEEYEELKHVGREKPCTGKFILFV